MENSAYHAYLPHMSFDSTSSQTMPCSYIINDSSLPSLYMNNSMNITPHVGNTAFDNIMGISMPTESFTYDHEMQTPKHAENSNALRDYKPQIPKTVSRVCPTYHILGNLEKSTPVNFDPSCSSYYTPNNELSLSLGNSEMSCTSFTHESSCFPFPDHANLETRFLRVMQEILSEITSYASGDLDDDQIDENEAEEIISYSSSSSSANGIHAATKDDFRCSTRETVCTKKAELLNLLQMVDSQCNQYLNQIQSTMSKYQGKINQGIPQMNARFTTQKISIFYRNLRNRIASHILSTNEHYVQESAMEKERSFETSFVQKHWALQQLKRNEHQSWRPQRGLPEKSVSVLKAWMFQNFLHPYPKDSEKQILAIQSGLTRSQVSNWFINARVRLWKPMIEEMYAEIHKRNQAEEGTAG